jgi:hypothetical protein
MLLVLLLVLVGSLYYLSRQIEYTYHEPDIDKILQEKVTPGYLDIKIEKAIKAENFTEVEMYVGLAEMLHVRLLPSTLQRIRENAGFFQESWRQTKAFASGFASGEAGSIAGLSGSVLSDMTLYGDLRDIHTEGSRYLEGKGYDHFVLGISLGGVGLSASQVVSLGGTTGLKVGASLLKVAKKTGKLSKPFLKSLSSTLDQAVDMKALRSLKLDALLHPKIAAKQISKSIDIHLLKPLLKDISVIKQETSLVDTVDLLKYVDSPKELSKIAKISTKYKRQTKGVMKVTGKRALRLVKGGIKWTAKLLWGIISAILSAILFLFGLFGKWTLYRKIYRNTSN